MPEPHARLRLRRTGGLAGVPTEAVLDTSELEPAEAERIHAALAGADLPALARRPAPPAAAGPPDAFRYELEVTRGDDTHTLAFTDADRPHGLAPVIDALAARARPAPRHR